MVLDWRECLSKAYQRWTEVVRDATNVQVPSGTHRNVQQTENTGILISIPSWMQVECKSNTGLDCASPLPTSGQRSLLGGAEVHFVLRLRLHCPHSAAAW